MITKTKRIILSIFSLTFISISLLTSFSTRLSFSSGNASCDHDGFHYASAEPYQYNKGHGEFWTCCKCHQTFTSLPSGIWKEGTTGVSTYGIPSIVSTTAAPWLPADISGQPSNVDSDCTWTPSTHGGVIKQNTTNPKWRDITWSTLPGTQIGNKTNLVIKLKTNQNTYLRYRISDGSSSYGISLETNIGSTFPSSSQISFYDLNWETLSKATANQYFYAVIDCTKLGNPINPKKIQLSFSAQTMVITIDDIHFEKPSGPDYLIKNGATTYQVLLPEEQRYFENMASNRFVKLFKEATGISLSVTRSYSSNANYISFGNTALSASIPHSINNVGLDGFVLKTDEHQNIIIANNLQEGAYCGANYLLNKLFNYQYFGDNSYSIDKNVTSLLLPSFDEIVKPSIASRCLRDGYTKTHQDEFLNMNTMRNYFRTGYIAGENTHNSVLAVENDENSTNDWYYRKFDVSSFSYVKKQVCFTAHGNSTKYNNLLNAAFKSLKAGIISDVSQEASIPGLHRYVYTFGIMDNDYSCDCSACKKVKNTYGSDSAAYLHFVNNLRTKLDEWLNGDGSAYKNQGIILSILAYHNYEIAPSGGTDESYTKCNEGVGVMYAPVRADFYLPLNDTNCTVNKPYYEALSNWAKITKHLNLWIYSCNFVDYILPVDTFYSFKENFKLFQNYNIEYIYENDRSNENSYPVGFGSLKNYLYSKFCFNNNITDSTYDAAVNNFFDNYYGAGGTYMKSLFDEFTSVSRSKHPSEGVKLSMHQGSSFYLNTTYWPLVNINSMIAKYDQAKALTIDDELAFKHVLQDGFSFLYLYVSLNTSASDIQARRTEFKSACETLGLTMYNENDDISALYEKLDLN